AIFSAAILAASTTGRSSSAARRNPVPQTKASTVASALKVAVARRPAASIPGAENFMASGGGLDMAVVEAVGRPRSRQMTLCPPVTHQIREPAVRADRVRVFAEIA